MLNLRYSLQLFTSTSTWNKIQSKYLRSVLDLVIKCIYTNCFPITKSRTEFSNNKSIKELNFML